MVSKSSQLKGLARMMVFEGLLEEEKALHASAHAEKEQKTFVLYLIEKNILTAQQIAELSAKVFGTPLLDITQFDGEYLPLNLVNEKLIVRHQVLPLFKRGQHLFLAVSDPSQQTSFDEIKFHTGLTTHCVVVYADKLNDLIQKSLDAKESTMLGDFLEDGDLDQVEFSNDDEPEENDSGGDAEDAPIVRFVHKILLDAIKKGASDIHFEPYEKHYRIRFRVDGVLYEVASPPFNLSGRIASRLKIMSQLDISERRIPQDGRFMMKLSRQRSIDFRVSTCPTVGGEKVVMRLLDPSASTLGVEKLGFFPEQKESFTKAINEPQGMVLVTGPTGSGKTVTLYTALNLLNNSERNISTAEDPVELKVTGINQVHINPKTGLTFSAALRSFLRQDPDIIMVGEIRDLETAEIAIKAAQTGHLVLSTLHTNSAPETLTRLVNMGVAPFNIASSISLIIAQRLARRLCEHCKVEDETPKDALIEQGILNSGEEDVTIYRANGCDNCSNGYKGRVGLYEVLCMNKALGEIIMQGGSSLDIEKTAVENGMSTLRQSGIKQIRAGITTITEVNRVTKD